MQVTLYGGISDRDTGDRLGYLRGRDVWEIQLLFISVVFVVGFEGCCSDPPSLNPLDHCRLIFLFSTGIYLLQVDLSHD